MSKEYCCFCGASLTKSNCNNALPLKNGYCCNDCNVSIVIPYRFNQILNKKNRSK